MKTSDLYTRQADLIKALAHPTRIRIVELLRRGERCVCEIYENLELEQSNVSQHLSLMKKQGILDWRKEGLRVMYRVKYPQVFAILDLAREMLRAEIHSTLGVLNEKTAE
ncbi:MAG: winged helix-turn-helix transcriptional regulator [Peptococcaceae bacterium]|nr:winged helix-turn-helix transcriptional regulator [Peptococcaceae bacterium]